MGIKHEGAETLLNPESTETMEAGDILLLIGSAEKLALCATEAAFDRALRMSLIFCGHWCGTHLVSNRAVSETRQPAQNPNRQIPG